MQCTHKCIHFNSEYFHYISIYMYQLKMNDFCFSTRFAMNKLAENILYINIHCCAREFTQKK